MPDAETLAVRRAAGAVLRSARRPGVPLQRLPGAPRGEALRPALFIEALVEAMRARFQLSPEAAARLFLPALADWRDAVGCVDPLLLPLDAQGPAAEAQLVPLPLPSWSTWLIDAGVLQLAGPPRIEGPRVVQPAWLLVVREAELAAVECFPISFAGRFASGAASLNVHLAISPPFLSDRWRGPICLRAAAHRGDRTRAPVPLWLGAPAAPSAAPVPGAIGETVVTWVLDSAASDSAASDPAADPGAPDPATSQGISAEGWPACWPRWAVLRVREGREPQALWDLSSLWRARFGTSPEGAAGGAASGAPVRLRLAVDIGSTATVVVEEDSAVAGSLGAKLLSEPRGGVPSGFRLLAGDRRSAHLYGCSELLLSPAGQLPTALCAATPRALSELIRAGPPEQAWLPQAPLDPGAITAAETLADPGAGPPRSDALIGPLRADRFKSPELLLLCDWLSELPGDGAPDAAVVSRRLLECYGQLVGRTLACAHAAPLVTAEGGRWTLRWPRLEEAEAILTYPRCAWSAADAEPFSRVFDGVGRALVRGLQSAWSSVSHRMVPDPAAARSARDPHLDSRFPIELFADFGGLTLQITVRVPHAKGRPFPFITGSSMSYLLGGERLIDAAAYASADLDRASGLRDAYRATARRWRQLIASGGHLSDEAGSAAPAVRHSVLDTVFTLLRRQLEGTLRRAAPDLSTLRGAGVRLYLLGEGWKLAALDAPDDRREEETLRWISERVREHPLLDGASLQLQRMTKRRLCEGALRVPAIAEAPDEPVDVELQGVDLAGSEGLRQRWFGLADASAQPDADLAPHPDDAWWRALAGGSAGSLLRVEQWFGAPAHRSPFDTGLSGGKLAFDPRRSVLKQWLDISGPSLLALRIHAELLRLRSPGPHPR